MMSLKLLDSIYYPNPYTKFIKNILPKIRRKPKSLNLSSRNDGFNMQTLYKITAFDINEQLEKEK